VLYPHFHILIKTINLNIHSSGLKYYIFRNIKDVVHTRHWLRDTFNYDISKFCAVNHENFVLFCRKGRFCVLKLKLDLSQTFTQQGPCFFV
jgi:hypothetical protein